MESRFRQTPHDAGAVRSTDAPVPSPAVAAPVPIALAGSVDAVIALQRTAGNQATGRALGRKLDERTAEIERHVGDVSAAVESHDEGMIDTAFTGVARLDIKLLLDVMARLRQAGAIGEVKDALHRSRIEEFHRNRIHSAIDAALGQASAGEGRVEDLPEDERDVVGSFGPAKPGISGDDPEGNTYVVYDTGIKTYFMTTVEKSRGRPCGWPTTRGNSDQLGGMGLGTSMKWAAPQVRDLRDDEGRPHRAVGARSRSARRCAATSTTTSASRRTAPSPRGTTRRSTSSTSRRRCPGSRPRPRRRRSRIAARSEALLDGFMNAEGIVEGKILDSNAQVTATMTPSQQKTMTFYLKLLGVRAK